MQEKICSSSSSGCFLVNKLTTGTRIKLMSMAAAPALMGLTRFKGQFNPCTAATKSGNNHRLNSTMCPTVNATPTIKAVQTLARVTRLEYSP